MDPTDVLAVRFHFGGEFIRIGLSLDYVGGDIGMSEIERDKLSLPELKGFLGDHMTVKDSMKFHFLLPDRELTNGLLFLFDDAGVMKMSDFITDGGVVEVYVEYNGEQDEAEEADSGSDFEGDELEDLVCIGSEDEPDLIIIAEDEQDNGNGESGGASGEILEHIVVPNEGGVITQLISSPVKKKVRSGYASQSSQVVNPTPPCETTIDMSQVSEVPQNAAIVAQNATTFSENVVVVSENAAKVAQDVVDSSDSEDIEYVAHTYDSGEESEVVELRKHARKFRKKMRDSKRWADTDANGVVPIALVANVEEDKIAQHRYKDMEASEGKFFKLEHCWELLQKCEKWKLIDKESLLLAEENKIMSMNRDDIDDITKTWHDMTRREILKRRMVFSAPYGGNVDELQDELDGAE
ncbi:hypothetical protein D1007_19203 [Hordeum vulgare]|nr:hypothetical protein D1007_19203 [Hordeum vulgare]